MTAHDCHRVDDDGRPRVDDDGRPLAPDVKTCSTCKRSWCERCDPSPAAMCHFCNGRGSSPAEIRPEGLPIPGTLVYIDSFSGLIPAKYLEPSHLIDYANRELARCRITATRKAYKRGDVVDVSPTQVVERGRVHVRNGHYVIRAAV